MRRLKPENVVQEIAVASAAMGVLAGAAALFHGDAGLTAGGVALGMWLAALYADLRGFSER